MDEEYIENVYTQLGGEGTFGKMEDFKELITTDDEYIKNVHSTIGEETLGTFNDFFSLVKKKDESPGTGEEESMESITVGEEEAGSLDSGETTDYQWSQDVTEPVEGLVGEVPESTQDLNKLQAEQKERDL